jgi:hypothetical protein
MKINPLKFMAIALLFGTTLNGAAIATSLNQNEQEVENQLQVAIQHSTKDGYQLVVPRNLGQLNRGSGAPKTLLLTPNRNYIFVAVCDRNCKEIQLILKDMKGNQVASNLTKDPVALIKFKPTSEDKYQVTVKMEKCSARSCTYGLGIFSKD